MTNRGGRGLVGPELTPARRRELDRRVARVERLERDLELARLELARTVAAAIDEDGTSLRRLAERLGLSRTRVHALAHLGRSAE